MSELIMKLGAGWITAWVSVVIALCSLGFTIYSAKVQSEQARLSVRPLVDFTITSGAFSKLKPEDQAEQSMKGLFMIEMTNNGSGPAIIERIEYYWRDSNQHRFVHVGNAPEDLDSFFKDEKRKWVNKNYELSTMTEFQEGHILRPNSKYVLYKNLLFDNLDERIKSEGLLQVRVVYKSVYGEIYTDHCLANGQSVDAIP